jgi:surface protein
MKSEMIIAAMITVLIVLIAIRTIILGPHDSFKSKRIYSDFRDNVEDVSSIEFDYILDLNNGFPYDVENIITGLEPLIKTFSEAEPLDSKRVSRAGVYALYTRGSLVTSEDLIFDFSIDIDESRNYVFFEISYEGEFTQTSLLFRDIDKIWTEYVTSIIQSEIIISKKDSFQVIENNRELTNNIKTIVTYDELKEMIRQGEDVTNVDTSQITDMSDLIYDYKSTFNQDISEWDVSNVTNMTYMFSYSSAFNQDISAWDVSNVTDMKGMFYGASAFNQDISAWDVSNVTDMWGMFYEADSFNQDISKWNVSKVKNMNGMFNNAVSFNQDISTWDVSHVTEMKYMFERAIAFNQDISEWDVSNVNYMTEMFERATSFNQDISTWDVSNVRNMRGMFIRASAFNQDISAWDVSRVTDMS